MSDTEIIKALECCSSEFECHNGCPYYNNGEFKCRDLSFYKDTLDLINRQKAEIERLNKEVDRLSQVVLYNDGVTEMKVEEAKAEAYKEFAERLNAEAKKVWIDSEGDFLFTDSDNFLYEVYDTVDEWCKELTDNLVKEMVGE